MAANKAHTHYDLSNSLITWLAARAAWNGPTFGLPIVRSKLRKPVAALGQVTPSKFCTHPFQLVSKALRQAGYSLVCWGPEQCVNDEQFSKHRGTILPLNVSLVIVAPAATIFIFELNKYQVHMYSVKYIFCIYLIELFAVNAVLQKKALEAKFNYFYSLHCKSTQVSIGICIYIHDNADCKSPTRPHHSSRKRETNNGNNGATSWLPHIAL